MTTSNALLDKLALHDVVQSWALYRDTGDWEGLQSTLHPSAHMTATWFDGPFTDFIVAVKASWRKGSSSQHFLGGTVSQIVGDKAIAQTRMTYEKDRMDLVNPGALLELDAQKLAQFPEGYRHLAYLQSSHGAQVSPHLATAQGDAFDRLLQEAQAWIYS